MALASEFVAAYRAAHYAVLVEPELVLRIGESNPRLDALLASAGAPCAAFLTAYNPRSERRGDAANRAAAAELDRALADANYSRFAGEGRDPAGRWPAEPSALVLGIPRADAEALGRRFGQNAIVWLAIGCAPELVFTRKTRLVLDTNAWLDWLVFNDAGLAPIRAAVAEGRAEIFIDEPCLAELVDVLTREFGRYTLDAAGQAAALAECRSVSAFVSAAPVPVSLPTCRDPDDQKFLVLSTGARADVLVTKDAALLELDRRKPPFRILTPEQFALAP